MPQPLVIELNYEKTTENFHVFKTAKRCPEMFPNKIYVAKDFLSKDPQGVKITIEEQ